MNWKKNVFSYFLWLLYTVMTGSGLFCVIAFWGSSAGYSLPIEFLICCLCLLGAGAAVLFLNFFERTVSLLQENKRISFYMEGAAAIALLGAGLFLCIRNFPQAFTGEEYYELAKVTEEGGIIQVVHGAVYLYLQLLHITCLLFGNKIAVCMWLQIILYLLAAIIFYWAVRRLAGIIPAIVMLVFMMFSPFLTAESRMLSPNILFLLIYAIALHVVAICLKKSHCSHFWYVLTGIIIGFLVYLDIMGATLLLIMLSIFFVSWEGRDIKNNRGTAFGICLGSGAAGFAGCIVLDTLLSGKEFISVLGAWASLYMPKRLTFPKVSYDGGAYWDIVVLLFLMCMGIFSFWCKRKTEKTSIWVIVSGMLIGGQCFQMTTDEMPGFHMLYLFFAVLAGVGIANAFDRKPVMLLTGEKEGKTKEKKEFKFRRLENNQMEEYIQKTKMFQTVPEWAEQEEEKQKETQMGLKTAHDKPTPAIQYIENPLPLPKKHIARKMDYKLEVVDLEMLDYDYHTDDEDDYDI